MNNKYPLVLKINSIEDLKKLENNNITEYININVKKVNKEIIDYFIENGQKYYYSDIIDNKQGYIYVDYETFKKGEDVIDAIITTIPKDLEKIEICKYLYKSIGKIISYDINVLSDKNDTFNINKLNTINNIWGALSNFKATNISYTKIFLYLSSLLGIDNEIITTNDHFYLANKIKIEQNTFITDITKDIPFIQAKFKTKYFGNYNELKELDKKIKYIKTDYNDNLIKDKLLKINYNDENYIEKMLKETENIINIKDMGQIELGLILEIIIKKYCPEQNIKINNLYTIDIYNVKEHFLLITANNNYYSFNYKQNKFVQIKKIDLEKNIENKKIGIYLNEIIPNININDETI